MLRSLVLFCLALILAACQAAPVVPTNTSVPTAAPSPTLTPTPFPEEFCTTVQVGEYAMDIRCRGSGEPTIILENGLDMDSWIFPRFNQISRTCTYPRVGLVTAAKESPRTTLDQVKDLHELLEKSGIPGPYILVGHSIAGYNLPLYAGQYPNEVVGLVCVDCRYPVMAELFLEKLKIEYAKDPNLADIIKDAIAGYSLFENKSPDSWESYKEKLDIPNSAKQVMNVKTLKDIPFIVLVASNHLLGINETKDQFFASSWNEASLKLSQLSSQGRFEVVPNTDHSSIKYSDAVAKAIQEVYSMVKKSQRTMTRPQRFAKNLGVLRNLIPKGLQGP